MNLNTIRTLTGALSLLFLAGCASTQGTETSATSYQDPRDPLESANRVLWNFNYDVLDTYVLRPVTVGYMAVVPKPARHGISNVVDNLDEPVNALNALLQFKPKSAAISTGRFVVNSTLGLFGLFDVATVMNIQRQNEDFGQTLAVWGIGDGPFLMMPALGPSTARDTTGRVVDNLYFPATWLNTPLALTKAALKALDAREKMMPVEKMLEESLDPYSFIKEAYYQRRSFEIHDGNVPETEEDDSYLDEYLE